MLAELTSYSSSPSLPLKTPRTPSSHHLVTSLFYPITLSGLCADGDLPPFTCSVSLACPSPYACQMERGNQLGICCGGGRGQWQNPSLSVKGTTCLLSVLMSIFA